MTPEEMALLSEQDKQLVILATAAKLLSEDFLSLMELEEGDEDYVRALLERIENALHFITERVKGELLKMDLTKDKD
jgi:hypothetical protein